MAENTYLLPIGETISLAWSKVKGSKGSIWAALLVSFLIMFALGFFDGVIKATAPSIEFVVKIIIQVVGFLLQIGLLYIGIKRAQDEPITYHLLFRGFESNIALRAIGLYILQVLILIIPLALMLFAAILYGMESTSGRLIISLLLGVVGFLAIIYLGIRMMLSMAFVLDKGMNPWPAITQSFAATNQNFWRLIAVIILQLLIIAVSAIPLGIGLIWTLPFAYILYGCLYKYLVLNVRSQV